MGLADGRVDLGFGGWVAGSAGGRAGRRFHGPVGVSFLGLRGWWRRRSGRSREGLDAGERGGEGVGPGPVGWDVQPAQALAVGDPGGGVQESVAQGLGFSLGEVAVQGEVQGSGVFRDRPVCQMSSCR
jgi:hypothetical protein